MTDSTYGISAPRMSRPIDPFGRFIGTWEVSGDRAGTLTYEWLPGGYFILERVSLSQNGHPLAGVALIGQTRGWRGAPSPDIRSRFYDSDGNAIDYVQELNGDRFTIWVENKGSDPAFEGKFSDDPLTLAGTWYYPGGSDCHTVATKVSDVAAPPEALDFFGPPGR